MNVMNEEKKHEFLGKLLPEGEMYFATVWAVIMSGGAIANQYCYMGMTEHSLCFACVDSLNPDRLTGGFNIPLTEIQKCKIKKGLFGRTLLYLTVKQGNIKISIARNCLGSKLDKDKQLAGIDYIVAHLS